MLTILESGTQSSEAQEPDTHIMLFRKAGTQDVVVQVADAADETPAWVDSGVVLDTEAPIKPFFTCKGLLMRVHIESTTQSEWDCDVAMDRLNEPHQQIFGTLNK